MLDDFFFSSDIFSCQGYHLTGMRGLRAQECGSGLLKAKDSGSELERWCLLAADAGSGHKMVAQD